MKQVFAFLLLLAAGALFAQNHDVIPGRLLVLVTHDDAGKFEELFASALPSLKDPQSLSIADNDKLRSLIVLPKDVLVEKFRPLVPQHSVANSPLRVSTNPILFYKTANQGIKIVETPELARLRKAEDRVSRWFEIVYTGSVTPEALAATVKKSASIEEVTPRYHSYPLIYTPNDSLFLQQYAPPQMSAGFAWDIVKGDTNTLIAVIDIGTDWSHKDLRDAIYTNYGETGTDSEGLDKRANGIDDDNNGFVDDWHGWDFAGYNGLSPDNNPVSGGSDHGTHTGGIMCASGNNKTGVCGIAFGARLLPLKAGDNGGGTVDHGYQAIVYAADMGASVANNSWGGTTRSPAEQDLIEYATAKNCAVVGASGNNGAFQDFYPASYKGVLSVAGSDPGGNFASYSNFGPYLDLAAPGTAVLSTVPGDTYRVSTGTSMAAPNAAAALALVRQKYPYMSPEQAMEQLRAATDQYVVEEVKKGYTGRGRVNIHRAVKDTVLYSSRIERVEILDENGNGILEPSERADIVIHARNYLARVENLNAEVSIMMGNEAVDLSTPSVHFGSGNTLDLIQNLQGSLKVTAFANAAPNTKVLVRVTFYDTPSGYGPDYDYFTFIVNPAYLDLNKNDLTVTFDSKANIGYGDPPMNNQGSGFLWSAAPEHISPMGRSLLWQAGLMVGISTDRLVSGAPSADGYSSDQNYRIVSPIRNIIPDKANAVQELVTTYADSNASFENEVGVQVTQRSYAFTEGASSRAVVIDYLLRKRETTSGASLNDSTSIALFMDWDIGLSGAINSAKLYYDGMTAITKRLEDNYPVVAVQLISGLPPGAERQYYAIDNDGSNGSVSTYGGYDRSEKWYSMIIPRLAAGPGDVSTVIGLKNVPMKTLDSLRMTYVIALGETEADALASVDKARDEFYGTVSVRDEKVTESGLLVSPNPFGSRLTLKWNGDANAKSTVNILDILGREILRKEVIGNETTLTGLKLTKGSYVVRVVTGDGVYLGRVVGGE
jgi:serine protease